MTNNDEAERENPQWNKAEEWQQAQKKPVVVEYRGPYQDLDTIETIEGDFEIDEEYLDEHGGYVLIRGVDGEIYPCALDIFEDTYEVPSKNDG